MIVSTLTLLHFLQLRFKHRLAEAIYTIVTCFAEKFILARHMQQLWDSMSSVLVLPVERINSVYEDECLWSCYDSWRKHIVQFLCFVLELRDDFLMKFGDLLIKDDLWSLLKSQATDSWSNYSWSGFIFLSATYFKAVQLNWTLQKCFGLLGDTFPTLSLFFVIQAPIRILV